MKHILLLQISRNFGFTDHEHAIYVGRHGCIRMLSGQTVSVDSAALLYPCCFRCALRLCQVSYFYIISASFLHHSLSDFSLMAFIHGNRRARLQVYAPDDSVETAFHRTIYLFCCPKQSCFVEHQRQQSLHPSGGPKRSSFTPWTLGGCAFVTVF